MTVRKMLRSLPGRPSKVDSATGGQRGLPSSTKRLNVEMSEDEYYALKHYALEQRKTVSEVVREAITTQMRK